MVAERRRFWANLRIFSCGHPEGNPIHSPFPLVDSLRVNEPPGSHVTAMCRVWREVCGGRLIRARRQLLFFARGRRRKREPTGPVDLTLGGWVVMNALHLPSTKSFSFRLFRLFPNESTYVEGGKS